MKEFDIKPDTVVVTSAAVTDGGLPILYVAHESDEETGNIIWQFHPGNGNFDMEKMRLVGLGTILKIDPSVADIADLPLGCSAIRQFKGAPWETIRE